MKFYKWNNDYFGDYDMFIIMSYDEVKKLVEYYGTIDAVSTTFDGKDFFYMLNKSKKIITPILRVEIAFGNQYNGYSSYGNEILNFEFNINDYSIKQFEGELSYYAKPDKFAIKYIKLFEV